jgi:hypothetical protein
MVMQNILVDKNGFNIRNGIRVTYDVAGADNLKYPWVHGIPTLKAAVAIAKDYPGVYGYGSTSHIARNLDKLAPTGSNYHHTGGLTHEWRVFKDDSIQLTTAYRQNKQGINEWRQSIPKPPSHTDNLEAQLHDMWMIADHIGYKDAAAILRRVRPESSTAQVYFPNSEVGHKMLCGSNEGAMGGPTSISTARNSEMKFIKPEYVENHKQLEKMEDCMSAGRRGSLRSRKMWIALFLTGVAFVGINYLLDYFLLKPILLTTGTVALLALAPIICAIRLFFLAFIDEETWDDILLKKLTAYVPANKNAFEILQSEVRKKNDLNWGDLRQFIVDEKNSMFYETINENLTNFLQRSI